MCLSPLLNCESLKGKGYVLVTLISQLQSTGNAIDAQYCSAFSILKLYAYHRLMLNIVNYTMCTNKIHTSNKYLNSKTITYEHISLLLLNW